MYDGVNFRRGIPAARRAPRVKTAVFHMREDRAQDRLIRRLARRGPRGRADAASSRASSTAAAVSAAVGGAERGMVGGESESFAMARISVLSYLTFKQEGLK